MFKIKRKGILLLLFSIFVVFAFACSVDETMGEDPEEPDSGVSEDDNGVEPEEVDVPEGATEVVFWDLFGGEDGLIMNQIVEEFNESQSEIFINHQTQEWAEYYTRLMTAVLGDSAPDLGISHTDRLLVLINEGVIDPIDKEIDSSALDWGDFLDTDAVTVEGNRYAVPLDYHSHLLYYNKSILQEAGVIDGDETPEINSYDDFIDMLTQIKESDYYGLSFPQEGEDPIRLWVSLYAQMGGGNLIDDTGRQVTFNNPTGIESFQMIYDLYNTHEVVPQQVDEFVEVFRNEDAGFVIAGTWALHNLHDTLGDDLGVMAFPQLFDQPGVWANSHNFILPVNPSRDAETTEAAMAFVEWVTENGEKWAEAGHLPTTQTILNSDAFQNQPFREDYMHQSDYLEIINPASSNWLPNAQDTTDAMLLDMTGIEDGINELEDSVNSELSR